MQRLFRCFIRNVHFCSITLLLSICSGINAVPAIRALLILIMMLMSISSGINAVPAILSLLSGMSLRCFLFGIKFGINGTVLHWYSFFSARNPTLIHATHAQFNSYPCNLRLTARARAHPQEVLLMCWTAIPPQEKKERPEEREGRWTRGQGEEDAADKR